MQIHGALSLLIASNYLKPGHLHFKVRLSGLFCVVKTEFHLPVVINESLTKKLGGKKNDFGHN